MGRGRDQEIRDVFTTPKRQQPTRSVSAFEAPRYGFHRRGVSISKKKGQGVTHPPAEPGVSRRWPLKGAFLRRSPRSTAPDELG
jgi:hypothetical protein